MSTDTAAWVVAASGKGRVRHQLDRNSEGRPWPVCGVVGTQWRISSPEEIEALRACPNCKLTDERKLRWMLEAEVRGAERRMDFAKALRNMANRVSGRHLPSWGMAPFPSRFIDDEQQREFADCMDQTRSWLLHTADILDPPA